MPSFSVLVHASLCRDTVHPTWEAVLLIFPWLPVLTLQVSAKQSLYVGGYYETSILI